MLPSVDLVRKDRVKSSASLILVVGARGVAHRALRGLGIREGGGAPAFEAVLQSEVRVVSVRIGAHPVADLLARPRGQNSSVELDVLGTRGGAINKSHPACGTEVLGHLLRNTVFSTQCGRPYVTCVCPPRQTWLCWNWCPSGTP